jgi:hypothetical protein
LVVELQIAGAVDQSGVHGRGIAETGDLLFEAIDDSLEEGQGSQRDRLRLRKAGEDALAHGGVERSIDAAGDDP